MNIAYKSTHEVLFSEVVEQLKKYRLKTVFIETLDDGRFSVLEWRRIPSIEIDDIDATPYGLLSLIYSDRKTKSKHWGRPYGGVL